MRDSILNPHISSLFRSTKSHTRQNPIAPYIRNRIAGRKQPRDHGNARSSDENAVRQSSPGKILGAFFGWPRREGSAKGDKSPEKYPGAGS